MTRSLFDTARQYRESFDAYGSKKSFEWQQVENEEPVIHTKSTAAAPLTEAQIPQRVKVPDYAHLLPEPIRRFTQPAAIQDADHLSFLQGGGHGGSHPHLVHNFLLACLGEQPAMPDAETSVNWTMVGICAHQSALKNGEEDRDIRGDSDQKSEVRQSRPRLDSRLLAIDCRPPDYWTSLLVPPAAGMYAFST